MNELQYCWLKLAVWYHTNFCFNENEIQLLSLRFIRKNTVDELKLNILVDGKHWIVAFDD